MVPVLSSVCISYAVFVSAAEAWGGKKIILKMAAMFFVDSGSDSCPNQVNVMVKWCFSFS